MCLFYSDWFVKLFWVGILSCPQNLPDYETEGRIGPRSSRHRPRDAGSALQGLEQAASGVSALPIPGMLLTNVEMVIYLEGIWTRRDH